MRSALTLPGVLPRTRLGLASALGIVAALAIVGPASAAGIKNGKFERGNLSGWAAEASSPESTSLAEWRVYSARDRSLGVELGGSTLPLPIGDYSAAFVESGPSNGALSQAFRVGPGARYLTLRTFWINQAGGPVGAGSVEGPRGLGVGPWVFAGDFVVVGPSNQYLKVDLIRASADPLSGNEGSVLASGFSPTSATETDSGGWQRVKIPLRKLRGKRVRLRLAQVNNLGYLNVGLDSVRIVSGPVPRPVTG